MALPRLLVHRAPRIRPHPPPSLLHSRLHLSTTLRRPITTTALPHPPRSRPSLRIGALTSLTGALALYLLLPRAHADSPSPSSDEPFSADNTDLIAELRHHDEDQLDAQRSFLGRVWLSVDAYLLEPIKTGLRFVHLGLLFLPVLLVAPVLLLGAGDGKEPRIVVLWYDILVKQMERAGPTFVKLAQWAGSRRDLFPAALCARFGRLHANGKPHTLAHTKRSLSRAFGKPFEEIFEEFDEKPLGIGAIAQVYKASLKAGATPKATTDVAVLGASSPSPGTVVAIKVLHPRVHKTINRDLKIMSFFASLINFFPGAEWLSFPEEVQVFGELMASQLDLRVEASNLLTFSANFSAPGRAGASFPKPVVEATKERVLVEEYEDAVPLKAFLRDGGGPFDKRIANIGLDAFLHMLLIDNFVHSDLHPGNIFVKFHRPSSRLTMRTLLASLLGHMAPVPSPPPEITAESLAIAHELRDLSHAHVNSHGEPIEEVDEEGHREGNDRWVKKLEELDREGWQPELVFIDAGLTTSLNDKDRVDFLDLFKAIVEFDGYRAGQLMIERCRTPHLAVDPELFALKMQNLVLNVKKRTFSLGQIALSDVLTSVLLNVRSHHVKMEPDFVNVVISCLLLEGIGRQLDPQLDLFKSSIPILRKVGGRMGSEVGTEGGREGILKMIRDGSALAMVKIWVWAEMRQLAEVAVGEVDGLVKYDRLCPNV